MTCQVVFENGEISKVYSPNGQESNLYNQILSRYQGNKEKALEKWVQLTTQKDTLRLEQLDSNGEPIVNDDLYLAEDISPIINFYKNEGDKSYSDSKAVFNRVLSRLKAEYPLLANRIRGRKVMSGGGYVYKFGLDNPNLMYQLNTPIKKGVEELFESNPELANQVYEALGFEKKLPFIKSDKTIDDDFFIKDELIVTKELQNIRTNNFDGSINKELSELKAKLNTLPIGSKFNVSEYTKPVSTNLEELLSKINLSESNKVLLEKIKPLIKGVKIEYVDKFILTNSGAVYSDKYNTIRINKSEKNIPLEELLMHELLHAATFRKISYFETNTKGLSEKELLALNELESIRKVLKEASDKYWDNRTRFARSINPLEGYRVESIHEIISYAFTDKSFRDAIADIPYKGNKSILDKLVELIANIFGVKQDTILQVLLANTEVLLENNQITPQQKQQAQQLYSQYLESLNKPNTNPILQGNQQEQVKKFAELQERLNNKEFVGGAKNAFESSEELQQFGTQEQYNDYIARVSLGIIKNPSSGEYNYYSKVKDIVYHGTKSNEVRTIFDKNTIQKTGVGLGKGFFFAGDKSYSQRDVYSYKTIGSYLLNLKNPIFGYPNTFIEKNRINDVPKEYLEQYSDEKELKNLDASEKTELMQKLGYDGVVYKQGEYANENVVFEPEQIHILGGKQDIEGFKEFKQSNKYQQKSSVETRPSDEKLNKKIATLLEGIGVKTDYLKDSRYKDNSPLGIADMLNKVAYISMNRAKIDTLAEEAAHFFVDYLEQTGNPLFNSMMYDIGKYNTYMETYKEYQNTYLTNDGTPDINKIKKEAIGKMIAKIIVDKNNVNESQNLIDRFVRWLNKVMDLIKEQLVRLGLSDEAKIEDYFELAATNILAGKYQGEFKPYDEIFLQQSDTQKKLDNIITERNSEIRTVKKTDEEESIKEIFENGEWKRIKRVSDITKTKGKYYNNTETRTDIEKTKNKNQAVFGEKIHNDLMILMNKALGKTDNRPFMLNSAYHEKMQNFVDSIISQFNPDTHQYYTEVNIHNKNLAGTIDLLIVDSEGKANLFDYKSITGLLNNVNIGTNYTDKWYEQLIQYRKILTDYGITKFGQTRVIPIAVNFSDKVTAKEGSDDFTSFNIGTNTYEAELTNLNPVPLPEERTGNKSVDSMIDRINDRIRQLNAKPSQENTFKINELKKDIANLQVSKNLEVIAYQAETDLGILGNLLDKAKTESLNGDEIYDLMQLYNYYEDRLEAGLYKNSEGVVISEIVNVTATVQENKEKIDELLKLYNNTLDVTDETIKPSSWWNRIYKLSDYDIPAFQGLYKLFNRVAAQKEIKIRKLKEDIKDIISQIKAETGVEGEKMFYPILQKDEKGNLTGKLIAQKDKKWFDYVTANKSSLYKNMDSTDVSYIKNTPLGQYIKFDEFKTWFDAKMKDKLDSLRTSNEAYKTESIRRYKAFLINVSLTNPNGKYYDIKADNFGKFLNPDYKTHVADKPNSGLAKLYNKYIELNRYANENANAGIDTNFLPYIRKNTIKNLVDSGFNLRKLKDNVLNDLQSQEWETFELDSNGNKIYKIPLKFNIDVKKRDLTQQSLDLGEMLVLWADSVYNNKLLQDQHDTSLLFLEGLRRSKEYVTKNGKLFTKNGEVATKPVEVETIEQYIEYHNDIFYGQTSKDEDAEIMGMSRRKLARAATQYFSGTQLALNIFSGLSSLTGGLVNAITYAGNQYTKKQYGVGLKSIFGKDSKTYAAIKMFNVDSNIYDANQFKDVSVDKINKLFTWDKVFLLQKKGDWLIQNATLVAMMQNYTIKNDSIVKKTDGDKSLIELLEMDSKGKYSLPIRNEEELFRFREKVRNVNSQIIGNTSEYDKQLAGNTLIGQLALQFRRWMLPMGVSRFGSLKYNSGLEEMSYGKYRSTGKLLWETTVKEMTIKPLLEFIKNTKGGKLDEWLLSKYNEDLILNSKLGTFDEYRDLYFRNMKSTIMEASVLIGLVALKAGLKGDDDEEPWKKVLTRVLSRTTAENSFWFTPDSFFQIVQTPIPIINLAKNVTDILTLPKDAYAAFIEGDEEVFDNYDAKFGKLVIGYNAWLSFLKEIDRE